MKVFGGLLFIKGKQVRTIIATKTKKRAAELLNVSICSFNGGWSQTGNGAELKIALSEPETIFCKFGDNYRKESL